MRLLLISVVVVAACLLSCSPDEASSPEPRQTRNALSVQKNCKMARLPGTDPSKNLSVPCIPPTLPSKTPTATLLAKQQQQYIAAWKKQAPSWSALSDEQREAKRMTLKASIVGK